MMKREPNLSYFRFLYAELRRLDLLLEREILRLRALYQLSLDEFHGLYVSDEQVESLIAQRADQSGDAAGGINRRQALAAQAETMRAINASLLAADAPWQRLVYEFDLSPLDEDILLLALAAEIDLKYEAIYAYVNNDVARKWPTLDLAMRLFGDNVAQPNSVAAREEVRAALAPDGVLLRHALLQWLPLAADHPHAPARGLVVAPSVAHFLLGQRVVDAEFSGCVSVPSLSAGADAAWQHLPLPAPRIAGLRRLARLFMPERLAREREGAPLLVFEGRAGMGRRAAAEALCRELGHSLLCVDLEQARASAISLDKVAAWLLPQARLWRAGIYLENGAALFGAEGRPLPDARPLLALLDEIGSARGGPLPIFLACPPASAWREWLGGRAARAVCFDEPDYRQRAELWRTSLAYAALGWSVNQRGAATNGHHPERQENGQDNGAIDELAGRFVLTPGQIRMAVDAALDEHLMNEEAVGDDAVDNVAGQRLRMADLVEAARAQSDHSLARLAVKVPTPHSWDDLVLPPATLRRVREIAGAIRCQHVVYGQWAFGRRVSAGQGLKVLFAGASGTGKTMTAGVLARDAGLDLYKIDLSGVVSKYIGETEKNLESIFRAARHSNALLFFDEADALFGKRSEVKDAHDRYANIEISYLLQRMEQHEGAVILASNLSKNIDEAFTRRMHYVIEFPLPDEEERRQLWRGIFAPQAPLAADVDLPFLAQHFAVAGGDIQNVALDAAFLAAQDGRVISMKHLTQAMARQLVKQGRVPSLSDFREYFPLLEQG